jgi:hypothetical protein
VKASIGERKATKCDRLAHEYLDAYLLAHRRGPRRMSGYARMRKLVKVYRQRGCGSEIFTLFTRVAD